MRLVLAVVALILTWTVDVSVSKDAALETVSKHGKLSVNGTYLVNENGEKVQLKGMSLFWDVWSPQYYNKETIDGIHGSCHSNVVRAACAAATQYNEGYVDRPGATLKRLYAVIDAAIEDDIYVIVDWHDNEAELHLNYSLEFFDLISNKYSGVPNLIYEIFSEPISQSWTEVLKPYHETVIKAIRANDPDSIIVLGTPTWSQAIDKAAADPITDQENIMYTLHFYAGTHKQYLRDSATRALDKGIPIFVTEYGTVNSNSTLPVDEEETLLWFEWLDEHNISHVNWGIYDSEGGAAAVVPGTTADQVCQEDFLTESGKLAVEQNKA